tara:strand:- start:7191 stop:7346 length:156 start_codon:yes stop_codon:yes gene_type:complete
MAWTLKEEYNQKNMVFPDINKMLKDGVLTQKEFDFITIDKVEVFKKYFEKK